MHHACVPMHIANPWLKISPVSGMFSMCKGVYMSKRCA